MPPRYAYWTILVDEQPTAFRSALEDELLPTFKRLKQKHPSARMVWFQNGKVWGSRLEAQEAMRERGERGREGDARQGGFRDRKRAFSRPPAPSGPRPDAADQRDKHGKLEWTPKGVDGPPSRDEGTPRPRFDAKREAPRKPEWKSRDMRPKGKPEWKPRGARPKGKAEWKPRDARPKGKPEWKPRDARPTGKPAWKPRDARPTGKPEGKPRGERLEWKARGDADAPARARSPKPKSSSVRDRNWRPGGDHKDPRQKYKDAKKAKWQRFKKNIRSRWEAKQGPGKKRRDEE